MIFLGGLPRSGNTLLSAILNQHPEIYCSPLSPLRDVLVMLNNSRESLPETIRSDSMAEKYFASMATYAHSFHSNTSNLVVIDRNKLWGDAASLPLMKVFYGPKPKIIFTVRDIESIVYSFLMLKHGNGTRYPDIAINAKNGFNNPRIKNKTDDDIRVDWLLEENHLLDLTLKTLTNLFENRSEIDLHIVDYDSLVKDKELTMKELHKFLEIDYFDYDYEDIQNQEESNDELLGYPANLHLIRQKLEKRPKDVNLELSNYAIQRCQILQFWKS